MPKVEALLKHFETKNSINAGKITVGDLTILALYMASQYFKIEEDFKNLVPSAKAGFQIDTSCVTNLGTVGKILKPI